MKRRESRLICWLAAFCFAAVSPVSAHDHPTAVAPDIPMKVKFADMEVNLDRTDMYERMDREMISLSFGHTNTILTIKRANRFVPDLSRILRKAGLPEDLVYLAAIESHFDNTAVSGAGAAGMWQLMPATAREYGLEVTEYVDERYDYEKATAAACKYFKKAYAKYGCWMTVAAAYNAGMRRISESLEAQNVDHAMDLFLNKETSRYVFRLLAMKLIMSHPRKYGFFIEERQLYQPLDCKTVVVDTPVPSWVDWAQAHGLTYSLLRELNPWIRKDSLPNKGKKSYKVKIISEDGLLRSKQRAETYDENWVK